MKDSWLEASIIVEGELAEAVAEVLARFAPNGVVIESTAVTADPDDAEGRAIGPLRVFAYLPMDDQIEDTQHRLEEALWYLSRIQPLPTLQFRPIQETNWAESWKIHYRPIPIGRRLMIVPAWLESPDPQRISIRIDPGMAFGTGTHPTTQLCLEYLEEIMSPSRSSELGARGVSVIDLGCGTAILAVAALKLGAAHALGVDIDAQAIDTARQNASANQVLDHLELSVGSLADIRDGVFSINQAPIVLANILAPVLIRLLDEGLAEIVSPNSLTRDRTGEPGILILSGILETQTTEVEAALTRNGLQLTGQKQIQDWVALSATKPPEFSNS